MTDLAVDRRIAANAGGRSRLATRPAIVSTRLLDWLVALWIFSGGFVLTEPSPYELTFLLVLGAAAFAGFGLYRSTLGLVVITVGITPFALIAAFQVKHSDLMTALVFQAVTIFLFITSYFVANYVAEAPQRRMRIIVRAYVATAVLAALIGTLGYLRIIPGYEVLTLYGRAKAFFNDPNVFGPFLILPAMFCLQQALLGKQRRTLILAGVAFLILFVGVFASYSRAAWGHFAMSCAMVYLLVFFLEAHAVEKTRMMIMALVGALLLGVALAGLLSIPQVQRLFEERASAQSYDEGDTGRFGRQAYAFELALENPLGIGPLEFRNLRIKEEPHNSYVNTLHVYGWGGGLLFIAFIGVTLWRGTLYVLQPGPNRLLLIPLISVFLPLSIEAAIIDLDHWRHFFLIGGLIWGVTAGYRRVLPGEEKRHSALI